jgi:hypothetical protein
LLRSTFIHVTWTIIKKIVYPPSSFMGFFGELTPKNILPFVLSFVKYFLASKMIYFIFLDLFYEFF